MENMVTYMTQHMSRQSYYDIKPNIIPLTPSVHISSKYDNEITYCSTICAFILGFYIKYGSSCSRQHGRPAFALP